METPPLSTNPETPLTPPAPQPLIPPTPPTSKPPTILIFTLLILAVAAVSFLLGKYSAKPATSPPITPTPLPRDSEGILRGTPTPDLTADWKTYTNETYGFQIKYPPDWGNNLEKPTATKTKFFMGLWPESAKPKTEKIGPSIISISIEDYRLNYTDIDTWWTAYLKYISTPIDVYAVDQKKDADKWYEVKKILMDQKPALYLTSTSYYPFRPHKKAVVLNKNNEAIEFNIETAPDNPYLPFFDQILSTFKFLDQAATKTTPTPALLNKTYEDKDFGYSISYSKDWIFRHTYGQDIEKLAPTDILSGIDLHQGTQDYTQASIVINLLDAHGLADIKEWITKYDLNYPKNSTKNTTTFKQLTAINYRYQNSPERQNEALYFISGTYAYRIFLDEKGGISDLTRSILESFTP